MVDGPASDHDERVARYCEKLALLAGLGEDRSAQIRMASRLHDIGKVTIPSAILDKTGPLDDDERRLVQEHAEFGYRLLFHPGRGTQFDPRLLDRFIDALAQFVRIGNECRGRR